MISAGRQTNDDMTVCNNTTRRARCTAHWEISNIELGRPSRRVPLLIKWPRGSRCMCNWMNEWMTVWVCNYEKTYHAKVIIPNILDVAGIVDCVVVLHHFVGMRILSLHRTFLTHSLTHLANLIDIHFAKSPQFPLLKRICNSFSLSRTELRLYRFLIRGTRVNKKIRGFFPV